MTTKDVPASDNLAIWSAVDKTDPKYTKAFSRSGGFSGTAINATWLARRATEVFGPIGLGWGLDIIEERYVDGAPMLHKQTGELLGREVIHVLRVQLWYERGGKRGAVTQFGQTTFVGNNKYGPYTDEEAPKKSLTDGMSKCLSLLGFASDIHLGLFDDNKYVNDRKREEAEKTAPATNANTQQPRPATVTRGAAKPQGAPLANGNGEARVPVPINAEGSGSDWPEWAKYLVPHRLRACKEPAEVDAVLEANKDSLAELAKVSSKAHTALSELASSIRSGFADKAAAE